MKKETDCQKTLREMERRHCKDEKKLRKDLAEMKAKYDRDLKVYEQCNYTGMCLEKELNDSLKRGK